MSWPFYFGRGCCFGLVLFLRYGWCIARLCLFAELLADAALSASLYRHLRGMNPHWFATALRKTFIPFCFNGNGCGPLWVGAFSITILKCKSLVIFAANLFQLNHSGLYPASLHFLF